MKAKGRNVCVIGNARGNSLVIVSDISNGDVALSQVSDLIVHLHSMSDLSDTSMTQCEQQGVFNNLAYPRSSSFHIFLLWIYCFFLFITLHFWC